MTDTGDAIGRAHRVSGVANLSVSCFTDARVSQWFIDRTQELTTLERA